MKGKSISFEKSRRRSGTIFVLPWIVGFFLFFLKPIFYSLVYSISSVSLSGGLNIKLTGLSHYAELITKRTDYLPILVQTVTSIVYDIPLILAFSLFIAILLTQKFWGRGLARGIMFLPVIITSGIVMTILKEDAVSGNMLSQSVNTTLYSATGLNTILTDLELPAKVVEALTGVVNQIFDLIWQCGIQIVLFTGALTSVPHIYYEVANIEGANAWLAFWTITFPTIIPQILIATVYSVIDSFTHYSNPMMKLINVTYKSDLKYDLASAMAWMYFAVILVILGMVFLLFRKSLKNNARI